MTKIELKNNVKTKITNEMWHDMNTLYGCPFPTGWEMHADADPKFSWLEFACPMFPTTNETDWTKFKEVKFHLNLIREESKLKGWQITFTEA